MRSGRECITHSCICLYYVLGCFPSMCLILSSGSRAVCKALCVGAFTHNGMLPLHVRAAFVLFCVLFGGPFLDLARNSFIKYFLVFRLLPCCGFCALPPRRR